MQLQLSTTRRFEWSAIECFNGAENFRWHLTQPQFVFFFFFAMARTPSAGPNVANEVEVNLLKH